MLTAAGPWSSLPLASPAFADSLTSTTARIYRELPPETRERTALVATPYVYAAYLDVAPSETGLPAAASPHRAYGWFTPPPEHQDRMVLVGDPTSFVPWFASIGPLGSVTQATPLGTYGGLVPETTGIWLLEGRNAPWSLIWSERCELGL